MKRYTEGADLRGKITPRRKLSCAFFDMFPQSEVDTEPVGSVISPQLGDA
jgi:hypothetical protein